MSSKTGPPSVCPNGHPRTPSNLYVYHDRDGYLIHSCRPCRLARARKQWAEIKAGTARANARREAKLAAVGHPMKPLASSTSTPA